jgi:S1-C subfamily serine protease
VNFLKKATRIWLSALFLALSILACGFPSLSETETPTNGGESNAATDIASDDVTGDISTADLARATVQIFALRGSGTNYQPIWTGSGSIITPEGLVLTNAHVVDDRYDEYDTLGIAETHRTDEVPELAYLAEIAAVDYDLDLAVVRIVSDMDGRRVSLDLPVVELGDSDQLEIGDELRVLGYPGIGGTTITYTIGAVSGFTTERGVEGRAWIKTDATIAGGNSGGMGVNSRGELIGVPTIVSSGEANADTVDCRPLADTNRDGRVDNSDTCVPVGGFINALRPVNLARPLIESAISGDTYVGESQPAPPGNQGNYNTDDVSLDNLLFATGVNESDEPVGISIALPNQSTQLCLFWDYEGMIDGMAWALYWFRDGQYLEDISFPGQTWNGGSSGNWWACISDNTGLINGLYEVTLEVEGDILASEAVYVGGDRSTVNFTVANNSSEAICYVQLSPNEAQNWGPDELGSQEVIQSNQERVFEIASGVYDLRLLNCDVDVLAEQYQIEVGTNITYTLNQ